MDGRDAGAAIGLGSAAVAIFVEGANAYPSSPYPPFFTKRDLLAYDVFQGPVVSVGAVFGVAAVVLARRTAFRVPTRSGLGSLGRSLMLLGSGLLFTRLIAVIRGS